MLPLSGLCQRERGRENQWQNIITPSGLGDQANMLVSVDVAHKKSATGPVLFKVWHAKARDSFVYKRYKEFESVCPPTASPHAPGFLGALKKLHLLLSPSHLDARVRSCTCRSKSRVRESSCRRCPRSTSLAWACGATVGRHSARARLP